MLIKLLLATVAIAISTPAFAFSGWMNIHIGSIHLQPKYEENGESKPYNKSNYGLGLALPIDGKIDFVTGYYQNSFNKSSLYIGSNFHTPNNYGFSAGLITALVTGYEVSDKKGDKLVVALVPHISYALKNIRAEIGMIPSMGVEHKTSIITFTVGTRF